VYDNYERFLSSSSNDDSNYNQHIRRNFHSDCDYFHDYESNNKAGMKTVLSTLAFDHMYNSLKLKQAGGGEEHRSLANGDFNQLNRIMGKVAIIIPDPDPIEIDDSVPVEVLIQDIVLTAISIGDMTITHSLDDQNRCAWENENKKGAKRQVILLRFVASLLVQLPRLVAERPWRSNYNCFASSLRSSSVTLPS